ERNLIDYGDQIRLAVRLLADNPGLAAGYRDQYPVALLDEYQDTNFAQRRLLELLYPPGSAICAVGDDMQSIYAFRGAHLANIQRFPEHFSDPPLTPKALQTTFRFGPSLVALANRIQGQVGASGLLDRPEVVDVVAWLEVLADPAASIGLLRVLEGPRYRLGRRDLATLARHARRLRDEAAGPDAAGAMAVPFVLADALDGLDDVPDLSDAARSRLAAFCAERRALAAATGRLPVLDLAEAIVQRTGLWRAAGERGRENLL